MASEVNSASHRQAPRWIGAEHTDAPGSAFAAAGALAWLDPIARAPGTPALLWRRRLALQAAATLNRMDGRSEEAGQIRDHWILRRPQDDPGPAGRLLAAWRALADPAATEPAFWQSDLAPLFGLPPEPLAQAIHGVPVSAKLPIAWAARLAGAVLGLGPAWRGAALWLADAALARALGWPGAVPLLAAQLRSADLRRSADPDAWQILCANRWARAALQAAALHSDLACRAERLTQAAPRLRARDAAATVAALLSEEALAPRAGLHASDRAARRLFERLTALGLVRELSGRAQFRIYGL